MTSLKEAKWKEAMDNKIQSMCDNHVWNLVDPTVGLKPFVLDGSLRRRHTWMGTYRLIKLD